MVPSDFTYVIKNSKEERQDPNKSESRQSQETLIL